MWDVGLPVAVAPLGAKPQVAFQPPLPVFSGRATGASRPILLSWPPYASGLQIRVQLLAFLKK